MKKLQIYGLPPLSSDDTEVVIFDAETFGTNEAIELARGRPDEEGVFLCALPKKFKGKFVELVTLSDQYSHMNETLPVGLLGVFHTVRLKEETNSKYAVTHKWPFNSKSWHREAQEKMRNAYREAKHKNIFLSLLFATFTITACFVGHWVADFPGLVIGCLFSVLAIFLSSFAAGQRKGI